jgi:hypothetical protein
MAGLVPAIHEICSRMLILAALFCFPSIPASAQTAEETIIFMLYGYEKGDSGWYPFDVNTLEINRETECRYKISFVDNVTTDEDIKQEMTVDFSGVSDATIKDVSQAYKAPPFSLPDKDLPAVYVKFIGVRVHISTLDPPKLRKELDRKDAEFLTLRRPLRRVERAVEYFRSTYCKGRAF